MNRLILTLLACFAVIGVQAQKRHYAVDVHDFTNLDIVEGINVVYTTSADSAGWVSYDCAPAMASHLLFSNDKNTLKVQIDRDGLPNEPLPVLYVKSSNLVKAENSGDSTMVIKNLKPVNTLSLKLMGNGKMTVEDIQADEVDASLSLGKGTITLSGTAKKAKYSNVSTGDILADGLKASFVTCNNTGTGTIRCFSDQTLKVRSVGSGTVVYSGEPRDISKTMLGGKLKKAE